MSQYSIIIYGNREAVVPSHDGRPNGDICKRSEFGKALTDCCKSGDCEPACRYVLEQFEPVFRIVKVANGCILNTVASHADKVQVCKEIYFDSDRDWAESEEWCNVYLIWQAAHTWQSES